MKIIIKISHSQSIIPKVKIQNEVVPVPFTVILVLSSYPNLFKLISVYGH